MLCFPLNKDQSQQRARPEHSSCHLLADPRAPQKPPQVKGLEEKRLVLVGKHVKQLFKAFKTAELAFTKCVQR